MKKVLLKIVLGEFENGEEPSSILYTGIVKWLWKEGFSGATVLRADKGIGEKNDYRIFILEDVQFNNLPIIIETIESEEKVNGILPKLKRMIPNGEIMLIPVYSILEEGFPVINEEHMVLKVYLKEGSHWFSQELHDEIMKILQGKELIWSTVTRGIEGFGKDHVIHRQKLFSLSSHLPVIIESVGRTKIIESLVPLLKERIQEGIVITYPVSVVINR